MRLVVQRVSRASVTVDGEALGSIEKGLMALWGASVDDTRERAKALADKLLKLRIFEDGSGKMNLSVKDVGGGLLIVSQFTLYADCRKGNRPSFANAMPPKEAEEMYEYFVSQCVGQGVEVEQGRFGADMQVELVNDGPVTLIVENG